MCDNHITQGSGKHRPRWSSQRTTGAGQPPMMTDDMFAGTSMQPAYVPPGYPPLLFSSFYYHSGFHPMSPQQPVSPIAFYPAQPAFDMTYSQASPMPATAVYSTSPHGAYHQPMFHPMVAPLSAPHMHPQQMQSPEPAAPVPGSQESDASYEEGEQPIFDFGVLLQQAQQAQHVPPPQEVC